MYRLPVLPGALVLAQIILAPLAPLHAANITEKIVSIPSDPVEKYRVVINDIGEGSRVVIVLPEPEGKRTGGSLYTLMEVGCPEKSVRYMGEGDTMQKALASIDIGTLEKTPLTMPARGSFPYYIAQASC